MWGGKGTARAATPRPSVAVRAINTASAAPPQQQPQLNTIAAPGEGGQGATRVTTPRLSVGAWAMDTASATPSQQQP